MKNIFGYRPLTRQALFKITRSIFELVKWIKNAPRELPLGARVKLKV
ncbi:hypothetical protein HMPREF1862_00927 [Varibaculum cambriense]|uniref:Uncharacterized protein n=1 Tax=Varibaculum cambriense TaxID=184870 RepID=A0AB34X0S2_9ACTO|nr:hypothetical protein HMPREF1862_00927 [Varibaculum cambriense]